MNCQPGTSTQSIENTDGTVTEDVTKKDICRDFIWGRCNKGSQCKFRHELNLEFMKKTLKFCHDFQNSTGCLREHCTFLHASKEEQTLFKATGQLPKVLAERHAIMSAAAAETIPQIALYIQESLASKAAAYSQNSQRAAAPPPPPPPPLPAAAASASAPQPVSAPAQPAFTSGHPRKSVGSVAPMVPQSTAQQLPPPPPPPTSTITSVQQQAPVFTGPPPVPTFSKAQPPPIIPMYDASKPPPPIVPMGVQPINGPSKRKSSNEDGNARPSKHRKGDEAKADCEQCLQKEQRIKEYKKEYDAAYEEEEYANLILKSKTDVLNNLKQILKSLLSSSDIFQRYMDDNAEDKSQNLFHSLFNQPPATPGVSKVPNQFLLQLMEYVMADARDEDTAPSQPASFDETLLQALSALSRKANPVKIIYNAPTTTTNNNTNSNNNNSTNNNSTSAPVEVFQTFMDIIRQCITSDKSPPPEYNLSANNGASTSGTNGPYQYPPSQQQAPVTVATSTFPPGPSTHVATTAPTYAPHVAPAPPPVYQPYQPMPPTGAYYPPQYGGLPTGMEMPIDKPAMRMQIPVTMQPPAPVVPPVPPGSHAPPAPPTTQVPHIPPSSQAPHIPPSSQAPHAPPQFYQTSHYAMGQYPPPYYQRHQ